IMIAIDPGKFNDVETTDRIVDELVADIKASEPIKEGGTVYYPGEIEINTRRDNMKNGIPVIEEKWETVCGF
ncbi:MAG: Ldh family oxidoreductase, partial [Clostridium sp.]|nr:Ldh family oxidoreductase [Clostridium sp.]